MSHWNMHMESSGFTVLQELLNTRMNNLYVEGFDDCVITEMINMFVSWTKGIILERGK